MCQAPVPVLGYVLSLETPIQGYQGLSVTVANIVLVTNDGHEELLSSSSGLVVVAAG